MYNTFVQTNISPIETISQLLQTLAQPARLQILLAIGETETCVCHLEAALGWRQAYLSQHLMALRKAGLLESRRAGRFIHYRLADPRLLALVRHAAELRGVSLPDLAPSPECGCPNCCKGESA
ncbi:MAG: winged helix-turn-helix transcriptional regulator [Chloroflexi bacterium]|nr:winged helix-turn-helix transcriptional regulator [Chloroflexota bacterium]